MMSWEAHPVVEISSYKGFDGIWRLSEPYESQHWLTSLSLGGENYLAKKKHLYQKKEKALLKMDATAAGPDSWCVQNRTLRLDEKHHKQILGGVTADRQFQRVVPQGKQGGKTSR
jgi:hypothetical protein